MATINTSTNTRRIKRAPILQWANTRANKQGSGLNTAGSFLTEYHSCQCPVFQLCEICARQASLTCISCGALGCVVLNQGFRVRVRGALLKKYELKTRPYYWMVEICDTIFLKIVTTTCWQEIKMFLLVVQLLCNCN